MEGNSSHPPDSCRAGSIPFRDGLNRQGLTSGSSMSSPDTDGAPATQNLSGSPSEPAWVGIFATAMANFTTSTQAMLGHIVRTMPAPNAPCAPTADVAGDLVPPKRPRVVTSAQSSSTPVPVPGVGTLEEDPMDLLWAADESSIEDKSDGECSDQEQEAEASVSPSMSVMVEDLITAIRDTFHIKDTPVTDDSEEAFFFPPKDSGKTFPVRKDLTQALNKAWSHPEKKFTPSKRLDLLYPFPANEIAKWSAAPKVDPPVARLAKHTTLPVDDGSSLHDPADRRVDFFSKNAFEAGGAALRPAFASAWVAKAATEWVLRLQREVVAGATVAELQVTLSLLSQAARFLVEASCDTGALIAQSTALLVAVRRSVWLKVWAADTSSKRSLTNLPFLGHRLFGKRLDEIISVATGGKSILLPQNKPKRPPPRRDSGSRFQSFRRSPASRYQAGQGYKPASAQGKRTSTKPKPGWRDRKQSAPSTSSKQSSA